MTACCVLQCLGCGMEEWRFKSASPCTFNCPLRQAKGSTRWRAPSHYQTAYKEWEEDEGLTPEPLCFDFGSPLPCSHHQHMWKHRRSADTDNTLGPLQWFKVHTPLVLQSSVPWLAAMQCSCCWPAKCARHCTEIVVAIVLMPQVAEPADKPTSKMGGSAQPGSPQPLWVKYHSRQAVILDLAGLDASTGDEIRQVSIAQIHRQCKGVFSAEQACTTLSVCMPPAVFTRRLTVCSSLNRPTPTVA